MKNLNIFDGNIDIALIALNPTKEALENGAVFSRDRGFWNVLERSGLTQDTKHVNLKDLAKEVFLEHKHSNLNVGFADLLPHIDETDSSKVKVEIGYAKQLAGKLAKHKTKKVALLGQKVVDAFAREYPNLKNWRAIKTKDGKKKFGVIGSIKVDGHEMELWAMPFPVNNSIKNKHNDYRRLLSGFIAKQRGECDTCQSTFGAMDSIQSTNCICNKCKEENILCMTCKQKGCSCGSAFENIFDRTEGGLLH
ncbi:uracil-DNA glycosylase family protein [Ancylomarina sp. YFZ004]